MTVSSLVALMGNELIFGGNLEKDICENSVPYSCERISAHRFVYRTHLTAFLCRRLYSVHTLQLRGSIAIS